MGGEKVKKEYEINENMGAWLNKMASTYGLPDEHKALRVLIDFAMQDGDTDLIFDTVRCSNC